MRIDDDFLNKNFIVKNDIDFKEGNFIRAKISEIKDENVILVLNNGEIIEANTNLYLESMKNQLITFLVNKIDDDKLYLKPVNQEVFLASDISGQTSESKDEVYINKVINAYKLANTEINKLIIKTAIKFNIPLTNENVTSIIKNVERLQSLLNVKQEDRIFLFSPKQSPLEEHITQLVKVDSNTNIAINLKDNNIMQGNLPDKKNETITNMSNESNLNFIEVSDIVSTKLKAIFSEQTSTQNLINRVAFLTKLDYDISLLNIGNLNNLVNNEEGVLSPLLDILSLLENNIGDDDKFLSENIDLFNSSNFKLIQVNNRINTEEIKKFLSLTNESLSETILSFENKKNLTKEINVKIDEFINSIELHNKINSYYTFVHIPIEFNGEEKNSNVFILKKKNSIKKNNFTLYLSLNTRTLKKVAIFCNIYQESIKLEFLVHKEFKDFFNNKFKYLKKGLESLGYSNIIINFKENKDNDLLEIFYDSESNNYNLNIRV